MNDWDTPNSIKSLEAKYQANQHNGIYTRFSSMQLIEGSIPILLDAPHAVRQYRNGEIKASDEYTGAMVEWLCRSTGVHGCIRFFNDRSDPNYDVRGRGKGYRNKLLKYCRRNGIRLLLDLHGSADRIGVCDIGCNGGRNLCGKDEYVQLLKEILMPLGKVTIDERFRASKPENICRFIAEETGIPAIQMEIGSSFRKMENQREQFLQCMTEFLNSIVV